MILLLADHVATRKSAAKTGAEHKEEYAIGETACRKHGLVIISLTVRL